MAATAGGATINPLYNTVGNDVNNNNNGGENADDETVNFNDDHYCHNNRHNDMPHREFSKAHIMHGDESNAQVPIMIDKQQSSGGPSNYVRLMTIIASINSCNLGYDLGVNAGVVQSFQRDGGDGLRLVDWQIELFIGILSLAALVGAIVMPPISDRYGRRATFIISQFVFILGIIIMISSNGYGLLMFGRAIVGVGVGLGLAIDTMYIAEIAPAQYRGQLASWAETAVNIGILLGFATSYIFRNTAGNAQWRSMVGIGLILPFLLLLLCLFVIAESPRWLLKNGRTEEAGQILQKCTGDSNADGVELANELLSEIENEEAAQRNVTWQSLFNNPVARRKLYAGVGMAVMQQITGEEAILYYMISILAEAGVTSVDDQFGALVMVGLAKVLAIVIAGYLFDYHGRRPLLMGSNCGIACALFLLAAVSDHAPAAGFAALVLYVVAFSSGMGPGAWLVPSEVFSNDIRAKGMSLCTFSNRAAALLVGSTFLSMRRGMTNPGIFCFYGAIAVANIFYIRRFVPETKGLDLEQVHVLFEEKVVDKAAALGAEA